MSDEDAPRTPQYASLISHHSVCAVIVASGPSIRVRGPDKLWADLSGVPLLARTLGACEATPEIGRIVVVAGEANRSRVQRLVDEHGFGRVSGVYAGGATRQGSVLEGLRALGPCGVVAVHDGARPLVTPELIRRGIEQAREHGSALCAVPAKSTHKLVGPDGVVHSTPPRERLWEAQTPQVFRYRELLDAHTAAARDGREYTDDAALMEAEGYEVRVYEGAYSNIKVTTPEDLLVARALLAGDRAQKVEG